MFIRKRILGQYLPFWSDIELASPEMSNKYALIAHRRLLEVLPKKVEYVKSILQDNKVSVEGTGEERFESAVRWLGMNARLQKLTRSQRAEARKVMSHVDTRLRAVLEEEDDDLDTPTYSMCFYMGYYFTELIRAEHPEIEYGQCTYKSIIDYRRTVLLGKAPRVYVEPFILMRTICYEWTENRNRDPQDDLRAFYRSKVDALLREPPLRNRHDQSL